MVSMTDDSLYRLRNVQKRLGSFTLRIQKLDIGECEVLGLLGPTGAGKSTLLQLLAGLVRADHGDLYFESQPFSFHDLALPTRRRMTLVHQRPLLLSGSVRFNVEYGLRLRGQQERADKVDEILDRLGLSKFALQSALTLSGGQTQLVALARALVIEPDVLLLDEPTAHLDPAHVALIEETMRQVRQECRMTVVWATHNLFQARRVASRTALLLNGQLVETASTEEFFTNPSDPRTADFVQGRMVY
jgi:tungstate transport system ATP-binding protein